MQSWLRTPAFLHLSSGAIAGVFSRTATAPLDRIKVVMQVSNGMSGMTLRGTMRSIRSEGMLAFFRGNGTNCIKIGPESAIKLYAYDLFKRRIMEWKALRAMELGGLSVKGAAYEEEYNSGVRLKGSSSTMCGEGLSFLEKLLCGAGAGLCGQLFIYPIEVVKTRLAVCPHGLYRGMLHCLTTTYQKEGILALYRGVFASSLGVIPYAGIHLACYDTLKKFWCSRHFHQPTDQPSNSRQPPVIILLSCGAISSSLAQIVSYPISLIRTRMQADGMNGQTRKYTSATHVLIKTTQEEGFRTLYRGIGPNLMKTVPAVSIEWAIYETSKRIITGLL